MLSLIGRGQITLSDVRSQRAIGVANRDHETNWRSLELKEKNKRAEEEAAKKAGSEGKGKVVAETKE